jgi:Utp14 protein
VIGDPEATKLPERGLLAMPFMRRALKQAAAATAAEARALLEAEGAVSALPGGRKEDADDGAAPHNGRVSFGNTAAAAAAARVEAQAQAALKSDDNTDEEGSDAEDDAAAHARLNATRREEDMQRAVSGAAAGARTSAQRGPLPARRAGVSVAQHAADVGIATPAGDAVVEATLPQGVVRVRSLTARLSSVPVMCTTCASCVHAMMHVLPCSQWPGLLGPALCMNWCCRATRSHQPAMLCRWSPQYQH